MKSHSLAPLLALFPIVVLAFVVGAHASQVAATPSAHGTYREYRNARWHFSVFIPDDVVANEYDARGGQTIQFIDAQGSEQLQVSVWRYQDLIVHSDGVRPLSPSPAADQPEELGTVHTYQNDLNDLFEVTFVKNGISYLVQTLPENETSTLDILKSWQFI